LYLKSPGWLGGDITEVAEGNVIKRKVIHGKEVQDDEVPVSVHTLFGYDEVIHPQYHYPIESGGFASWRITYCCIQTQ